MHPSIHRLDGYDKKLTYPYAFKFLKMKKVVSRNEYMDLAKETNLLWHQIISQTAKNR